MPPVDVELAAALIRHAVAPYVGMPRTLCNICDICNVLTDERDMWRAYIAGFNSDTMTARVRIEVGDVAFDLSIGDSVVLTRAF